MNESSLIDLILKGDLRALSKAITLIESKREDHRKYADKIISKIYKYTGNSVRYGITGPPGVGKSTFIDRFGSMLAKKGDKIAVLAVDPSSHISGGSILGDKTRMEELSKLDNVYIRPSPSSTSLGGVTYNTREAIFLCEAAGYNRVIIETVGTGQSEINIANMVDIIILLQLPNAGDDLQGIKKGIIEIADIIAINKVSGNNITKAKNSKKYLEFALSITKSKYSNWSVPILLIDALENKGIDSLLAKSNEFISFLKEENLFSKNRKLQNIKWFDDLIESKLKMFFFNNKVIKEMYNKYREMILNGELTPSKAAEILFSSFIK
ncbi:MAG: methylmalonyl Co-A mutase-associated GTPase MeaB [Deferribacterota bacterium]|nr:methylmalonyl Co-A mutase-associated GTPase MeaB [Deferribacterota bacterium]